MPDATLTSVTLRIATMANYIDSLAMHLETQAMALPPDLHMHTPLCRHARGEPVDYARHAASVGLREIGFSDHSPMRDPDFDDWRMRADQLDEYVEKVERARREVPAIKIRLALEVDYLPGQEDWIRELAQRHPWDYLIGSVHYVSDTWAIDNPHMLSEWKQRDADEVWTCYFERLMQAAGTGFFEILAHADLPKKFGHRPTRDCSRLYQGLIASAKRHACAIELNTAGLRKECREIYPSREILTLAQSGQVAITFGSDAHAPEEVGMNFNDAVALARSVGYDSCCTFEKRARHILPLPA
ncbi:MAG TPA: histidinol-phosphatase HisJ family protein [Verrucomicrobiae bacterium]|nr:histidinol-phosphatase HisJ family protein [Verrucomicrobiae bacterium]